MQQPCACPKKAQADTGIQNEQRLMPWRKLLHSRLGKLENLQAADTCSTADPMTASLPPKYTSKAFVLPGSGRIASKNTTSCTLHCIWGAVVSESSKCTCWLQQQEQNKTACGRPQLACAGAVPRSQSCAGDSKGACRGGRGRDRGEGFKFVRGKLRGLEMNRGRGSVASSV